VFKNNIQPLLFTASVERSIWAASRRRGGRIGE
jgi:hypothetical protein